MKWIYARGKTENNEFVSDRVPGNDREELEKDIYRAVTERGYGHCETFEIDENRNVQSVKHFIPAPKK